LWGEPPVLSLEEEASLHRALATLADKVLLASAADISDGGAATAVARACFPNNLGARISMKLSNPDPFAVVERLFSEVGSSVIATCRRGDFATVRAELEQHPLVWAFPIGEVTSDRCEIRINEELVISSSISDLRAAYAQTLESQLAAEVVTA